MDPRINEMIEEEADLDAKVEVLRFELTQDILRVGGFLQSEIDKFDADAAGVVVESLERIIKKISDTGLINWEE